MTNGVEAVSLAVMVLFGVATAGFLAFMLRDVVARLAVEGDGEPAAAASVSEAQRLAMLGPVVYLIGFLVVVAALLLDLDPVAGIDPVDVGLAIIVLAAVPMAAALYSVWQRT